MKTLLTLLFLSGFAGNAQIVYNKTTTSVGDKQAYTIQAIRPDSTEAEFKPGSVYYLSSYRTVVKILENWDDEKKFMLWALKPGSSTISIQCTRTDGRILLKKFVVTVMTDIKKEATGFTIKIIEK